MLWVREAGQGRPVAEAGTTMCRVRVRLEARPPGPQGQRAEAQADQADTSQSTGQSTVQVTSVSPGGSMWSQCTRGTGRPSPRTHRAPRLCIPGPHEDWPRGAQEVQGVTCHEKVQQVEFATQERVSSRGGHTELTLSGARSMVLFRVWRELQEH